METPVPEELTVTQQNQRMVEFEVARIYNFFFQAPRSAQEFMLELQRENHIEYLTNGLNHLGPSFRVLDANRPWICYWILHSIALLGDAVDAELEARTIDFLNRCQDPDGGYGGGPGQLPHLATTYAAVNSLVTLGSHEALSSINRRKLYTFLLQMKQPSGGFRMHEQGEIDVRACYTAISLSSYTILPIIQIHAPQSSYWDLRLGRNLKDDKIHEWAEINAILELIVLTRIDGSWRWTLTSNGLFSTKSLLADLSIAPNTLEKSLARAI